MIPVTPGMARQVGKGAHALYVRKKDRREADGLIFAALRESICPGDCDRARAEALAGRIGERLAKTPFPRDQRPTLTERVTPKSLREKLPGASDLRGATFSERLSQWLVAAMNRDDLEDELRDFSCKGFRVEPAAVASRFVANVHTQMVTSAPSRFRDALAKELEEAASSRKWRAETSRRSAEAIAATATAGIGAGGVAELAGAADPLLIGAGVAVIAAAAGVVRVRAMRSGGTALQSTVRRVAIGWVEDLLYELAGNKSARPGTPLRLWADELFSVEPEVHVSPELMKDLSSRVIPAARDVRAEPLEVALRRFEDVATRQLRGRPCSLRGPLIALLDSIGEDAVASNGCPEGLRDGILTW